MRNPPVLAGAVAAAIALTAVVPPDGELKSETRLAFERYVRLTEARIGGELAGKSPLLWIDRQPERQRAQLRSRLERGEIISERMKTQDAGKDIDVNHGMIHHWVGTVFLRGVPLSKVKAFVQDYDKYPSIFSPTILRSKVISAGPERYVVQMRTSMTKVITVVIDADYLIDYRPISSTRLHSKSVATNLHEVKSAGQPDEQRIPGDQTSGFLWRLNNYCSFEESPAGTIEQCESVSLTRGIPFGMGWLINPMTSGIPRDTLQFTLGKVRLSLEKR